MLGRLESTRVAKLKDSTRLDSRLDIGDSRLGIGISDSRFVLGLGLEFKRLVPNTFKYSLFI